MSLYAGNPEWHDAVYQVEVYDPVLGGSVSWRGDYPSSGHSNAAIQQLADRTAFLKDRVSEILGDIEEGVMSKVTHQETASISFEGTGRVGSPLRATLKESLDTIAWVRKDNTFTKDNFFRGVTEVEDPTGARGAVNKRTLDSGLAPKADKTYVDTELAKKQNKLTAGDNIQLDPSTSVISATDTRYTAGNGLTLSGTVFSLPVTKSGTGTFVKSVDQNTNGITVTLDTPPDTTYDPVTTTTDGLMTSADKVKLNGIATGATKNATDAQLRDRTTHTGEQPISSVTGLQTALDGKVENDDPRMTNSREWTATVVSQAEAEAGTATTARKWTAQRVRQAILGWWTSSAEKTKLDGIATGATKNATDAQLRDRTTHTGVQPISSVEGLQTALDSKVNEGDARLTNAREWTASIVSQSEAEAGTATSARKWTSQRVRQAIESWWGSTNNQTKLDGIQVGATKNATDAELRNRATHTGTQAISTVSGLQAALDSKVDNTDSRLTNSREWTGATISQAEAEAGTATTRRAFTAQRVRQAIEAWWLTIGTAFGKGLLNASDANSAKSSLGLHSVASSGNYNELSNRPASMSQAEANAGTATTARLITPKVLVDTISSAVSGGVSADALIKANNLSDLPNKTTARNNLGLGNAATRNVGESSGNLMEVGAFGLGKGLSTQVDLDDQNLRAGFYTGNSGSSPYAGPNNAIVIPFRLSSEGNPYSVQIVASHDEDKIGWRRLSNEVSHPWREIFHTGNFNPDSKQDKLTAGTNISISGNTISATNTTYSTGTLAQLQAGTDTAGRLQSAKLLNDWLNGKGYVTTDTKYSAGNGLTLSGTTFSLPVTVSGSGTYVQSVAQNANGITVTLGTPPNTTYSAMSVAELRTGTATTSRVMTAKNIDDFSAFVALSGTAITPNLNSGRNFTFTPTANSTINNPSNARSGQTGDIVITSGATSYTIGWGTAWKFAGGNYPTLSPNSITVVSYKVVDANTIICAWRGDIK